MERFEDLPGFNALALGEQQHPDVVPQLHRFLVHVTVDGPHDVQHALERGERVGTWASSARHRAAWARQAWACSPVSPAMRA
ncbi:hypothetical protein ACWGIU_11145 [Streptomyces sp. NPDC054840]